MTYTIQFQGATTPINENDFAGSENQQFQLTESPLYRSDTLHFSIRNEAVPSVIPQQISVTVDGRTSGNWELTETISHTDLDYTEFIAKRYADEQILADTILKILNDSTVTYRRAAVPIAFQRWAEILDGRLNLWIAQRLQDKGDRPNLSTLQRELKAYGYTVALHRNGPFASVAPDPAISLIPLESALNPTAAATALPTGYSITGTPRNSIINPLTRQLNVTVGQVTHIGCPGGGYTYNIGITDTLGEGVVLMEMYRYVHYFTQQQRVVQIPLDSQYNLRQKVSLGRDSTEWLIESFTHTGRTTTLRLLANRTLTEEQLRACSPFPYNQGRTPFNSRPGVPTVNILKQFTAPDPRKPDDQTPVTIDWNIVGGGAIARIQPHVIGHPLTSFTWFIRRRNQAGNYVLEADGRYYLDGVIDNPIDYAPTFLPLLPMAEGFYDITVFATNAYGSSDYTTPVRFQITRGTPELIGTTILTSDDIQALPEMTPEAQRRMFAASQLNPESLESSSIGTAIAITGASIAALIAAASGIVALSTGFASSLGVIAGSIVLQVKFFGWATAAATVGTWGGALGAGAASGALLAGGPIALITIPTAIGAINAYISRAEATRAVIITEVWGAGAPAGVNVQTRISEGTRTPGSRQNPEATYSATGWKSWEVLAQAGGFFDQIQSSPSTLLTQGDTQRERLLQTEWAGTYGTENQFNVHNSRTNLGTDAIGLQVQFRQFAGRITAQTATEITVAEPADSDDWETTLAMPVELWRTRQFNNQGNLLPQFAGRFIEFADPPSS